MTDSGLSSIILTKVKDIEKGETKMIYGYCRISRRTMNIERQERNIKAEYPEAVIIKEAYTGRSMMRPAWQKLYNKVESGSTIVFDSVSRMSRTAEEGFKAYEELYNRGVNLVFLKEPHINTDVYKMALSNTIGLTGGNVDFILEGVNKYLMELAKEQVKISFNQAEKEVSDLRLRTVEGLETARLNGKQIGGVKGSTYKVKKKDKAKEIIKKHSNMFGGKLNDIECMKIAGVSNATFYKYRKEIEAEIESGMNDE